MQCFVFNAAFRYTSHLISTSLSDSTIDRSIGSRIKPNDCRYQNLFLWHQLFQFMICCSRIVKFRKENSIVDGHVTNSSSNRTSKGLLLIAQRREYTDDFHAELLSADYRYLRKISDSVNNYSFPPSLYAFVIYLITGIICTPVISERRRKKLPSQSVLFSKSLCCQVVQVAISRSLLDPQQSLAHAALQIGVRQP